ncbi:YbbR-like domain-containing protein [Murdochiella vaginalis]|uniref:CdaR family protein n=1 Tax=Murdochiella vaginalis TaxID=1852373 RepID=UPI0008FEA530|nr:CdaR family protein [Murdochiella vaginalis]
MKLLKHNWQWKLTSLIIGILMWSYITAGVNPTQSATLSDIPIRIINQDVLDEKQLKITEMEFAQTSLRILGKRNDIGSLDRNYVTASIDAGTLKEGTQSVSIRYTVPANMVINEAANDRMQVHVEKVITKSRNVTIKETGALADKYVLRGLAATPQTIEVTGPRSLVERVANVNVVINLNGLTADTSANLQVHPVDQNGNAVDGIDLSLSSVNVSATISKQKEVPVQLQWAAAKGQEPKVRLRQATITPNTVLVMGKTADIDKLNAISTQPLDLNKMTKDGPIPVTLQYPDGITPVNDKLEYKAQITLDVREERTFSVNVDRIQSKNGGALKARPAGDVRAISLRLEGYKNDLDALHESDLVISADLGGAGTGLQTLPLEVSLPKDIVLKEIKPAQLLMTVE